MSPTLRKPIKFKWFGKVPFLGKSSKKVTVSGSSNLQSVSESNRLRGKTQGDVLRVKIAGSNNASQFVDRMGKVHLVGTNYRGRANKLGWKKVEGREAVDAIIARQTQRARFAKISGARKRKRI